MSLVSRLRTPVIIDQNAEPKEVYELIRDGEHPFIFLRMETGLHAIKSLALFMHLNKSGWDPWSIRDFASKTASQTIPLKDLQLRILDVLGEEVVLTYNKDQFRYITREDLLISILAESEQSEVYWLHSLFSSIPKGLMVADLTYTTVNCNAEAGRMLRMPMEQILQHTLHDILGAAHFVQVQQSREPLLNQVITLAESQAAVLVDFIPLVQNHVLTGYALVIQDLPSVENMAMELDSVKELNQDLEAILSTIYDEIVVVDAGGVLVRTSAHYIQGQWARPPHELIGQKISRIKPKESLMLEVIAQVRKTKSKVSLLRNDGDAPILSVGNPIFNSVARLERIVIASRDLTEVSQLQRELERTRKQSENYRKQFEHLRAKLPHFHGEDLVYLSPGMHEVMKEAQRIAQFSATVLLTGESGVGKEIVANAIHSLGQRRDHPLIKINCASIPDTLLESELFGYVKGAFSGARAEGKTGLFVKADKGTLFLDEISELPLNIQSKLLRAIQEREVYPVGATTPVTFDVHLITATNRSLHDLVATGAFREDLYYRINVVPIQIPPLRERKEDIAVLANHFLFEFNQRYDRTLRFSSSAIEVLEAYSFPGNVRELQNVVQRVAIKSDGDIIDSPLVEHVLVGGVSKASKRTEFFTSVIPLKDALDQVEQELILRAMRQYGNTTAAAGALGISQSSVSRKLQKYRA